jgi:tRNA (guanine10-N2)-dimethyltransferase
VANIFFVLSGEHPTLPCAELRSVLDAESFTYTILDKMHQVVRLRVDERALPVIDARCGLTRAGCLEIALMEPNLERISRTLRRLSFDSVLRKGDRIAARVIRLGRVSGEKIERLEEEIGTAAVSDIPGLNVDLRKPQVLLIGVLAEDFFILGARKGPLPKKGFFERRPRKRPFFHATVMSVKLSRCMVNLARPRDDDLVLDPFCGTGSILLEAGLMGFRVAGGDVKRRMVVGCAENLRHFDLDPALVLHDARQTPFRIADAIVTDPPYGRAATTMGLDSCEVLRAFFQEASRLLMKGRHICLAYPQGSKLKEMGLESGFTLIESHLLYVHSSLTREIAVFAKDN